VGAVSVWGRGEDGGADASSGAAAADDGFLHRTAAQLALQKSTRARSPAAARMRSRGQEASPAPAG